MRRELSEALQKTTQEFYDELFLKFQAILAKEYPQDMTVEKCYYLLGVNYKTLAKILKDYEGLYTLSAPLDIEDRTTENMYLSLNKDQHAYALNQLLKKI